MRGADLSVAFYGIIQKDNIKSSYLAVDNLFMSNAKMKAKMKAIISDAFKHNLLYMQNMCHFLSVYLSLF